MTDQPIGKNTKCPCGSGRKYKHCCMNLGREYSEDESGTIHRRIPISDELGEQLDQHMSEMAKTLGRELRPDDQLFPGQFEHIEHEMSQVMLAAGIDPAIVHAFEETGLLVSEENQHLFSEKDLEAWYTAIRKYRERSDENLAQEDVDELSMIKNFIHSLDPSLMEEFNALAETCETEDEFVHQVMIGNCPHCESDNTADSSDDPEFEDPSFAQCKDCGTIYCCGCQETFDDAKHATAHNCPLWPDDIDDELE